MKYTAYTSLHDHDVSNQVHEAIHATNSTLYISHNIYEGNMLTHLFFII